MIVSDARIEANRNNALKSRGPVTEAGKARSRANALTHGLTAKTVATPWEDEARVDARLKGWAGSFAAEEGYPAWLLEQVAVVTLKIERAERMDREQRGRHVARAGLCWDDDRRVEAEALGAKLAQAPSETVERLKATAHGCEWLIRRWGMLEQVNADRRRWSDEQQALAFDLMGTPHAFREYCQPGRTVDADGRGTESPCDQRKLPQTQIDLLKARRDELSELDELEQAMARADLLDDASPEIRRLRRYQGTLQRHLRWCLAQLQGSGKPAAAAGKPALWVAPNPVAAEDPAPAPTREIPPPAVEPEPATDIESDTEAAVEAPAGSPARRRDPEEVRRQARRMAGRRKRERLRS